MNCPNCQTPYSSNNPPKKLRNCQHDLCDSCLRTTSACPIDSTKVDYRRYTSRGFKVNEEVLQIIQKDNQNNNLQSSNSSQESNVKGFKPIRKNSNSVANSKNQRKISQKTQFQTCLLHSKQADLICCTDGNLICANCALFGQHKGHSIKNTSQLIGELTSFTQQALGIFDQMKEKEENLSEQIVQDYIEQCLKTQRDKQVKNIRTNFNKLIDKIRKAEKQSIAKLDEEIINKKNQLISQTGIASLDEKKYQWYAQVEKLGSVMQEVYNYKDMKEGLKYIDQEYSESFLIKRGQYLHIEFSSSENTIKQKIDIETQLLKAKFVENFDQTLESYCYFNEDPQKFIPSHENFRNIDNKTSRIKQNLQQKNSDDDILLDAGQNIMGIRYNLSNSSISPINEKSPNDSQIIRVHQVPITHSIHPYPEYDNQTIRQSRLSRSRHRKRSGSNVGNNFGSYQSVSKNCILTPSNDNTTKKRRVKIDIPEKYRQVLDDLKHDRSEIIDFGGAQLGDQNLLALLEYIEQSKKLRNLKLVRNKLSDECIHELLNACFGCKVTSLNLGQNSLTEKTLQLFEKYDLGDIRSITLSLNKINRRNVKSRIEQFTKRGITMSI